MAVGGVDMVRNFARPANPGQVDRIPGPVRTGQGVYKDGVSKSTDLPDNRDPFLFTANLSSGTRIDTQDRQPIDGLTLGLGPYPVGLTERGRNFQGVRANLPANAGDDRTAPVEEQPRDNRENGVFGPFGGVLLSEADDEQEKDNRFSLLALVAIAGVGLHLIARG